MSLSVHRSDFTVKAGHGLATLYLWARNPLFHTATILPVPRIFSLGRLPPATNAMEYTLPHRRCVRPPFRVNIQAFLFRGQIPVDHAPFSSHVQCLYVRAFDAKGVAP